MASLYLGRLDATGLKDLRAKLHSIQHGKCFICEKPIDLTLHADTLDVDHIEPVANGGKDDQSNFALTHSACNRSKQASDLRVARVLSRFDTICDEASPDGSSANFGHILSSYGGAKFDLPLSRVNGEISVSFPDIGNNSIQKLPIYHDDLSDMDYFFAVLPIAYLHHDAAINPRPIGKALRGLVEEFYKRNPQLHVGLALVEVSHDGDSPRARVRIFDGQHKLAAQVLLGVTTLPVRIFVDPDPNRLLTANTNAGTTLRQVAFDMSVQRRLGGTILLSRIERYRVETNRDQDDFSFSETDLVKHFRGKSRSVKRYILDNVRNSITHHADNKLRDFIEFGGKGGDKPLSYSNIEKTFYSFFIHQEMLDTPWDFRMDVGQNPREIEKSQIIKLMNIIAETIFIEHIDTAQGFDRVESKLQKGVDIPDDHLRAFRMAKEEILYCWLRYVGRVVKNFFITQGTLINENKIFQYPFPVPLWNNIQNFVRNIAKLPLWVNHDMSLTVFGAKLNYAAWELIFEKGVSPSNQRVLAEPLHLIKLIQA